MSFPLSNMNYVAVSYRQRMPNEGNQSREDKLVGTVATTNSIITVADISKLVTYSWLVFTENFKSSFIYGYLT